MKKVLLLQLLLIFSVSIFAQESTVETNKEGKDISLMKHTWKAQWVTHPTESTLDYGIFNFRREFELETVGEKYIVYVSADNRYRLFVNGEQVAFGPSIGDIDYYRYETIDIAKYLKVGKNVIAAEVANFGEHRRGAQQTFMTAFILQGDDKNGGVNINTGTKKWKV
ncbi:MAG: alpha-L-rhamnosidase N-terminal domain-containing protein, partial [Flavobacteriales bacterium]|nr:alpha-L-rhamnosidase N-terminal domain-containing protein [Flavobacteriales bacterium]